MNTKIITIAGIAFALVFVIIMALIFNNVLDFGNSANADITNIKESIASADLEQYNNKIVSGDTVASTINKMKETKDGLKMSYIVCKSPSESTSASNWMVFGQSAVMAGTSNPLKHADGTNDTNLSLTSAGDRYVTYVTSSKTISPVKEYKANILLSGNDVVVGIKFVPTSA